VDGIGNKSFCQAAESNAAAADDDDDDDQGGICAVNQWEGRLI